MSASLNRLRALRDPRGMTVMELMVAFSLAAVAAAVVYTVFISTQGSFVATRNETEHEQDARVVLGILTQEIRSAGSDVRGIGLDRFAIAHGDTLRVQSDLDGDGVLSAVDEPSEDVTWYHDSGNGSLVRRTGAGDATVLRDVTAFSFRYLDGTGAALGGTPLSVADRNRVRAVAVDLTLRITRNTERTWTRTVALRNDAPGL